MNLVEALKLTKSKVELPECQNNAIEEAANIIFKIMKNEMKSNKEGKILDEETKNQNQIVDQEVSSNETEPQNYDMTTNESIQNLNYKIKQMEKAVKDIESVLKKLLKVENKNEKSFKSLSIMKKIINTTKYPIIGAFSGAGAYLILNPYLQTLFNKTDSQVILTNLMFKIIHKTANLFN